MTQNNILRERIPYNADLSPEYLTALEKQLRTSERGDPLVFGGRTDIVNQVKTRLLDMEVGEHRDEYAMVVQGAPGAGKTTLINHLVAQVESGEITTSDGVRVISINGSACRDEGRFLAAVFDNIEETADDLVREQINKVKGETSQSSEFATMGIRSVWSMLEAVGVSGTVLLCMDETQNLKGYGFCEIVEDLHTIKTGALKILPLFAGLLDSEDVLSKAGLTRLRESPILLGTLSKSESRKVITDTLSHESLGLSGAFSQKDQGYLASSLTIASDSWPRHLHYYMRGVLVEILEDQQRATPLHEIDLNRALEFGHAARIDYYRRQLGRLRSSVGSLQQIGFIETLEDLSTNRNIPTKQLVESLSDNLGLDLSETSDMLEAAIHLGVLTPPQAVGDEDVSQIPIPSLRTFLQCGRGVEKTLIELRQTHAEQLGNELRTRRGLER